MEQSFLERAPDKKARIEAMTNGMVSPDIKALILLSMEVNKSYSVAELYKSLIDNTNMGSYTFPISVRVPFSYCARSLSPIGAIVETKVKIGSEPGKTRYVLAYEKTEDGALFGDNVAAMAVSLVARLSEREGNKDSSMWRIFGSASKKQSYSHRHGYLVYRVIELLAKNPDTEYRRVDIESLTRGDFAGSVISGALSRLGKAGVISYVSDRKDIDGKFTAGPSAYALAQGVSHIDLQEVQEKVNACRPLLRIYNTVGGAGVVERTVSHINSHRDGRFEVKEDLAAELSAPMTTVSGVLGALADLGCLKTLVKSGIKVSSVKANSATLMFWKEFLEPIGIVAETGDPDTAKFREKLEKYRENRILFEADVRKLIETYERERSHTSQGAVQLRQAITKVFRANDRPLKMSDLKDQTNALLMGRRLEDSAIGNQIKRNMREVVRVGRGIYALKEKC